MLPKICSSSRGPCRGQGLVLDGVDDDSVLQPVMGDLLHIGVAAEIDRDDPGVDLAQG